MTEQTFIREHCKVCDSSHVIKYGKYKDTQYYLCKPIVQSSVVAYNPLINREGRVSCLEMFCLWRLGLWSLSLHSICRIPLMTYFYPSIIGGAS